MSYMGTGEQAMSMNISSSYIMRNVYQGYSDLKDEAGRKHATGNVLM